MIKGRAPPGLAARVLATLRAAPPRSVASWPDRLRPTPPSNWQSFSASSVHAIGCCSPRLVATAARRFLRCPVVWTSRAGLSSPPIQPERRPRNAERDPRVSVLVLSDDWNGPWVQVDGDAEVLHMLEAARPRRLFPLHLRRASRLGEVSGGHAHPGQVADPNHPDPLGSDRDWGIPGRRGCATRRLISPASAS